MPKIREILLNLEGFKYASSLDLNMDIITYASENRLVTFVPLHFHEETTGTNAYWWGWVTLQ